MSMRLCCGDLNAAVDCREDQARLGTTVTVSAATVQRKARPQRQVCPRGSRMWASEALREPEPKGLPGTTQAITVDKSWDVRRKVTVEDSSGENFFNRFFSYINALTIQI
jgi:hypothetical protein